MNKKYLNDTMNMTKNSSAYDPWLADQECVFKPQIDKRSSALADKGRAQRHAKFSKFLQVKNNEIEVLPVEPWLVNQDK